MSYDTVFDPRGRVDAERVELAPRASALEGLRLGILDNTKWNANRLLRKTAELLEGGHGIGAVTYYRRKASRNPPTRRSSPRSPRTTTLS